MADVALDHGVSWDEAAGWTWDGFRQTLAAYRRRAKSAKMGKGKR